MGHGDHVKENQEQERDGGQTHSRLFDYSLLALCQHTLTVLIFVIVMIIVMMMLMLLLMIMVVTMARIALIVKSWR